MFMVKKTTLLIIFSIFILLIIYPLSFLMENISYFHYSILHIIIGLLIIFILSKIIEPGENPLKMGLITSLVVGVIIFIPNFLIYNKFKSIISEGFIPFFNVPNPFLFFILLILLFNVPFLLSLKFNMKKITLFSGLLIIIILIISLLKLIIGIGCVSFTCNEEGCFCKYTSEISSGNCPDCSLVCQENGKTMVSTSLPLSYMPVSLERNSEGEYNTKGFSTKCYCYCN